MQRAAKGRLTSDVGNFAVVVGAVIGHWYDKRARAAQNPERAERLGTLVASGLIVGESLWGVINAGLIVSLSKDAPIGIVAEDFALAPWLGLFGFVGAIVLLYGWMLRRVGRGAVTRLTVLVSYSNAEVAKGSGVRRDPIELDKASSI